jgi:neutral amino acid transport system ATP-binding protein
MSSSADRCAAPFEDISPRPGAVTRDPILVVDQLQRSFGGVIAVDVEHLEVQRGSITALIGPNGAGKTTLFNLLTGFDRTDRGQATFEGRRVDRLSAHRIARAGMVRTFQLTKALHKMSVIDNMKLAAAGQRGERLLYAAVRASWLDRERENEARADALLRLFGLAHMRDAYAGTLSGGQRKLLEMARALMASPTMVLLDEPTAGVTRPLVQSILEHVRGLKKEGMTVLFVEHDMEVVADVSDWVLCMASGALIAEGLPTDILANQLVIDAYLGVRPQPVQ